VSVPEQDVDAAAGADDDVAVAVAVQVGDCGVRRGAARRVAHPGREGDDGAGRGGGVRQRAQARDRGKARPRAGQGGGLEVRREGRAEQHGGVTIIRKALASFLSRPLGGWLRIAVTELVRIPLVPGMKRPPTATPRSSVLVWPAATGNGPFQVSTVPRALRVGCAPPRPMLEPGTYTRSLPSLSLTH